MSPRNQIACNKLESLWLKLEQSDPTSGPGRTISEELLRHERIFVRDHDFEDQSTNLYPPILFEALPPDKTAEHPIHLETEATMYWKDYDPTGNPVDHSPIQCANLIAGYVHEYAVGFRPSLDPIFPNTFLTAQGLGFLGTPFLLTSNMGGRWSTDVSVVGAKEDDQGDRFANVTIQVVHMSNGDEDRLLFDEFAILVAAMRNRALQPELPDWTADELEELDNLAQTEWQKKYPHRNFVDEERFPVLTLSYFGPQHGRILYGCMDGSQLVIYKSRIYDFTRREIAPIDFFARVALSRPVKETLLSLE